MDSRYACSSARRRQRVLDGIDLGGGVLLNGLDFLEVVDTALVGTPIDGSRQRLLVLRALHPIVDPLATGAVQISGGVRVSPIRVAWAGRLGDVLTTPDPAADPAELTWLRDVFLTGLPGAPTDPPADWDTLAEWATYAWDEPLRWLVVRVEEQGDFSTYRLALVGGGGLPPAGWDRILSAVDFSFKVECPSDFDCEPALEVVAPSANTPYIDYLARDFSTFRRLMLDRLSIILPGWRESSPADLGVTLVELVAHAADELTWYQDAVATEAYLATARRRISVRRHARLLDYRMHEGCNARAWVHLALVQGQTLAGTADAPALPASTPLLTWIADRPVLDPADLTAAVDRGAVVFETMAARRVLSWLQNEIAVHTWGEDRCCLRAGETSADLVAPDAGGLLLEAGDGLLFEAVRGGETGAAADADPSRRHVVVLKEVGDAFFDPVTALWVQSVRWAAADALPFDLCLDQVGEGATAGPAAVARGNLVLADHGRSVLSDAEEAADPAFSGADLAGEALVPDEVPAAGRYRPRLKQTGLSFCEALDAGTAASALSQDPRRARPALRLIEGSGVVWSPVSDLLASDDFAPDFVAEMENDRRARLRFGDGEYGRAPTPGSRPRALYRVGNGAEGNVGADALVHVASAALGGAVAAVRNPLPAVGGVDPEPLDEVKLYAPSAFRAQRRAVTLEDWATLAESHPEVQRAVATLRWTGSWHTVFLSIDRRGGLPVDPDFEEALLRWLDPYRLAGYDLEINAPRLVPLDIALSVCVAPGYFRADVEQALLRAFGAGLGPDGAPAFFHPDRFSFGQPVYLSAFVAAAMAVPGVAWVDTTPNEADPAASFRHRFQRLHAPANDELRRGYIAIDRLEIARLDNDPNAPENGRILFNLRGGL